VFVCLFLLGRGAYYVLFQGGGRQVVRYCRSQHNNKSNDNCSLFATPAVNRPLEIIMHRLLGLWPQLHQNNLQVG